MNINKKLDRMKQWAGERMGGEVKTSTSDEFKALEAEMNLRHEGLLDQTPGNKDTVHDRLRQVHLQAQRGRGARQAVANWIHGSNNGRPRAGLQSRFGVWELSHSDGKSQREPGAQAGCLRCSLDLNMVGVLGAISRTDEGISGTVAVDSFSTWLF